MYLHAVVPEDTIVAPATAPGQSAIAVIRVSGQKAWPIVNAVFKGADLTQQASHTLHYGFIMDADLVIDEVMVSLMRGPRSFTAEDSIEISCHGSMYIQQEIVRVLCAKGARLAEPGEFTLRAYLNGRIDLAQAEAVGDMIAAQNQAQLDMAFKQMRGGLSKELQTLRTSLLEFIALVELELDFGEEDVEFADRSRLLKQVETMQAHIQPLIDSFQYGNAIKQGIPVAIIGRPNAGKSSLLNLLLKEDRAIVSDIAGTTRDTIEEAIHIKGVAYRFVDTAGIRQTDDSIEQIGIEKALQKIALAEVVLYIFDVSTLSEQDIQTDLNLIQSHNAKAKVLMIANKADLLKDPAQQPQYLKAFSPLIMGSTKDQTLAQAIQGALQDLVKWEQHSNVIVNNARHQQCLLAAQEALTKATDLMQAKASSDLLAFELKAAVQSIGDISGLISNDEVLGYIFGKFCIGK